MPAFVNLRTYAEAGFGRSRSEDPALRTSVTLIRAPARTLRGTPAGRRHILNARNFRRGDDFAPCGRQICSAQAASRKALIFNAAEVREYARHCSVHYVPHSFRSPAYFSHFGREKIPSFRRSLLA